MVINQETSSLIVSAAATHSASRWQPLQTGHFVKDLERASEGEREGGAGAGAGECQVKLLICFVGCHKYRIYIEFFFSKFILVFLPLFKCFIFYFLFSFKYSKFLYCNLCYCYNLFINMVICDDFLCMTADILVCTYIFTYQNVN